jgi:hypothetical protein
MNTHARSQSGCGRCVSPFPSSPLSAYVSALSDRTVVHMYHSGVLQSSSIGVGILCLVFGMAGVPETKAQQNLPSWANPSPSQDQYQSEPSRRPRPDRSDPSREGTSPTDRPSQGGGGFRTMGRTCGSGEPSCPGNQVCVGTECVNSSGRCSGKGDCKNNETCVDQHSVQVRSGFA